MTRTPRAIVPTALCLILGVGAWVWGADEPKDQPPPPQQPKGTSETVGGAVDSVVKGIKRGARTTAETVKEEYQRARASIHDMGVQARVYSRLHWDKELGDAKIDLEFKDGTATLRGTVKSTHAKAKAVELARDTIGVDRVDDHLTIESAAPPAQPRTGTAGKTKS